MRLITCPECGAKVRLTVELARGKRLKCSKCSTVFAPEQSHDAPVVVPARQSGAVSERHGRAHTPVEDDVEVVPDDRPAVLKTLKAAAEDAVEVVPDDLPVRVARVPRLPIRRRSNFAVILAMSIGGVGLIAAALVGLVLYIMFSPTKQYRQREAILKELVKVNTELAELLESVEDAKSAKTAAPNLVRICDRLEEIYQRRMALPEPSEKEKKELEEGYQKELQKMDAGILAERKARGEPTFLAAINKYRGIVDRYKTLVK